MPWAKPSRWRPCRKPPWNRCARTRCCAPGHSCQRDEALRLARIQAAARRGIDRDTPAAGLSAAELSDQIDGRVLDRLVVGPETGAMLGGQVSEVEVGNLFGFLRVGVQHGQIVRDAICFPIGDELLE